MVYVVGLVGLSIATVTGFRSHIRVGLTEAEPVR
jgi:hypothetical protein